MDQTIREQLSSTTRSEFIRRALRFTIDNIDQFKLSPAASIAETEVIESIDKINKVRDLHDQLYEYKEALMKEKSTPVQIKQVTFLIYLVGEMLFRMNE